MDSAGKYDRFIGGLGREIDIWRQNNGGKTPSDADILKIGREMLFPDGPETSGLRADAGSPDADATKTSVAEATNTSGNIKSDTSMVDSSGKAAGADMTQQRNDGSEQPFAAMDSDPRVPRWFKDYYDVFRALLRGNPSQGGLTQEVLDAEEILGRPGDISGWERPPAPSDTVVYKAPDGTKFKAPPGGKESIFCRVYKASKTNGGDLILMDHDIGHFGTFDFQRDSVNRRFIKEYVDASNFAVGVYMNAAGYSLEDTVRIGSTYPSNASPEDKAKQHRMWINGWQAAASGEFTRKSE